MRLDNEQFEAYFDQIRLKPDFIRLLLYNTCNRDKEEIWKY